MRRVYHAAQSSFLSLDNHISPDCTCPGKVCSHCKTLQCVLAFNKHKTSKGGRRSDCRNCSISASRVYRTLHADEVKARQRIHNQKYKPKKPDAPQVRADQLYGLTRDQYYQMLSDQNYLCAICGNTETARKSDGSVRRISLDHDHATGLVRAFLCHRCNMLLGQANDDASLLRAMADYLDYHKRKAEA